MPLKKVGIAQQRFLNVFFLAPLLNSHTKKEPSLSFSNLYSFSAYIFPILVTIVFGDDDLLTFRLRSRDELAREEKIYPAEHSHRNNGQKQLSKAS